MLGLIYPPPTPPPSSNRPASEAEGRGGEKGGVGGVLAVTASLVGRQALSRASGLGSQGWARALDVGRRRDHADTLSGDLGVGRGGSGRAKEVVEDRSA